MSRIAELRSGRMSTTSGHRQTSRVRPRSSTPRRTSSTSNARYGSATIQVLCHDTHRDTRALEMTVVRVELAAAFDFLTCCAVPDQEISP